MAPITCPVCAASDAARVVIVKDGHPIARCPKCGLLFRQSLPTRDEIGRLYGADYFAAEAGSLGHEGYLDYLADEDVHRANARRRLTRIGRHVATGALLDVGCAAGFFVDEARRAGWSAAGFDVSEAMVDWGRQHLDANLTVATLSDPLPAAAFDCITMWDYIEHVLDPRSDLQHAHRALRPSGILALSTGDVGSLIARLSLRRWHLLTPRHHNYFFSEATMRRLLADVGFDVVSVGHPAQLFPLRYLAHKAALVIDRRPLGALARSLANGTLGALTVPANLWDVMAVIARRRDGTARAH